MKSPVDECACGCGAELYDFSDSFYFANYECQKRWYENNKTTVTKNTTTRERMLALFRSLDGW